MSGLGLGQLSAHGFAKLTGAQRSAGATTGTVTAVTGTAPITSTGGAAPAIGITEATTVAAGSMSAADKAKLDGIETGATANTQTATTGIVASAVAPLAPKESPAFTGTPTVPTAAPGTNSTQVANTEFVAAALSARTEVYQLTMSDLSTALTTGADKAYFRAPKACTLVGIKLSLFTASSSGSVTVDLLKNGVSVLSTQPAVLATQKTSVTSGVTPVFSTTAVAADDELSLSITGAGTGAKGLIAAIEVVLIDSYRFYVQRDPHYENVSLLLHCDGTNASTTITDSSSLAHVMTAANGAQITTSDSVFGGASLSLVGTNRTITVPSNAAFDFGSGDFTIELNYKSTQTTGWIFGSYARNPQSNGSVQWLLRGSGTNLTIEFCSGGVAEVFTIKANAQAFDGNWHSIAVVRSGNTVHRFFDGVLEASDAYSSTIQTPASQILILGGVDGTFERSWSGLIDEVRVTKGVARYTANFTPPTAPFPDA